MKFKKINNTFLRLLVLLLNLCNVTQVLFLAH